MRARRTIRVRTRRLSDRFSAGQPRRRLISALVVLLLILSAVLVKVGLLQTFEGDQLRSAASDQWTRDRPLRAQRGSIFDRNGEELALSVPASTVAVNPKQVTDPVGTAEVLAEVLGLDDERRDELAAEMADARHGLPLRRPPDRHRGRRSARRPRPARRDDLPARIAACCPAADTARSVIGLTDIDGIGIAGLERQYNNVLAGKPGTRRWRRPPVAVRSPAASSVVEVPIPGTDIVVTIDRSMQYAVEQALLNRVAELGARGGQAIVMDTDTGEVLAMASVRISDRGRYEITSGNYSARRRLRAGLGGQGHHDLGRPQRRDRHAGHGVHRAVAEGVHAQR